MITHRYVGVVMGLLMLMWFASGVVMLFVRWPELAEADRTAGLPPIEWSRCCEFGTAAVDPLVVREAAVEMVAGRPVLRLDGETIDLSNGRPLAHLDAAAAWQAAGAFAAAHRLHGRPSSARLVERDQWTVTGQFAPHRPFWRVRLSGLAATDLYVSVHDGMVVQKTDAAGRALNWFGAIPHWLYPEVLRRDVKLWTQVVVWTSTVGVFLTLTGLYLGIVAWRPRGPRATPFRGLMAWHHIAGLVAGLLTLTWVASGLISMNPWGLLEGRPDDTAERIAGDVILGDLKPAIRAAKAAGVAARQLRLAPLGGQVFMMADGVRLDAAGRPAPLSMEALAKAGRSAGPVAHQEMISQADAYYHNGHDARAVLPVWRVVQPDGTRFYLDPASGGLRARFDREGRVYRWLFEGLHRFDFIQGFESGPGWAAAMVAMLLLAGAGVATGVWLGWRRVKDDLERLAPTRRRGRRASA